MQKMIQVTVCDKCGNQTEPEVSFDKMDFCSGCYTELYKLISGWLLPEEEDKKEIEVPSFMDAEPKTTTQIKDEPNKDGSKKKVIVSKCTAKRNTIDWDKACALKLAGRSNAWIADELGINPGTVNVCIYKKLEEYKERKAAEEEEAKRRILE